VRIYTVADNIISPLGFDTNQNFSRAMSGESGISQINDTKLYPEAFYGAQIKEEVNEPKGFTKLEQLFIRSIKDTLVQVEGLNKDRTVLIVSTTKGNIDLLSPDVGEQFPSERAELPAMANAINAHFDLPHKPVVISNACISGVSAILIAKKLIRMGRYNHAIVTGGDLLTEFTLSGFQSLMAISDKPCKPYDESRNGITLGEACATVLVTNDNALGKPGAEILGGAQSNDANHISGPSRTGEGLKIAVEKSLKTAGLSGNDLDYINAHGTATLFNDEMESIAFDRLGLSDKPLNSLKGYFGHTLGAAGLLESILTIKQLNAGGLLSSLGFEKMGVSQSLNVVKDAAKLEKSEIGLKTVSGFGGCNAAIIFKSI